MPPKNNMKKSTNIKKNGGPRASMARGGDRNRSLPGGLGRNSSRLTRRDADLSKMGFLFGLGESLQPSSKFDQSAKSFGSSDTAKDGAGVQHKMNNKSNEKETSAGSGLNKSSKMQKRKSAPPLPVNHSSSLHGKESGLNRLPSEGEMVVNARSFGQLIRSARRMQETVNNFMENLNNFQAELAQQQHVEQSDEQSSERFRREMERVQRVRDMVVAKNNIKRQDNLRVTADRFDSMLKTNLGRVTNGKFVIQKGPQSTLPNITNLLHGRLVKTKLFEKLSSGILVKDEESSKKSCSALLPYKSDLFGKSQIEVVKFGESLRQLELKSNKSRYDDTISDFP